MSSAQPPSDPTSPTEEAISTSQSRPNLEKTTSEASSTHSPRRHHFRTVSSTRTVKETHNARSQYSTSEDDGASQRRINQYLIQQEIGRGSFGAVHLATDQFGQEYAVKEFSKSRLRKRAKSNLLRQRQLGQPSSRAGGGFNKTSSPLTAEQQSLKEQDNSFDLIKEEIAIMKKLNHGNLVSLIEVLDDPEEDSLYMVLEMCKKGVVMKIEMDEVVEPYDEESCRHWFRDLLLGIEYLHTQGIVHRDIKPDNCLLTNDDTLKIVDFGVSEMFEKTEEMRIAKSAGSPAFMAPELCQVRKDAVFGKPADIWSMGVTLYCLRFGHVPFQKQAVLELYESIINDPLEFDPSCNENLKDLLLRILEKDPAKRIKMEELREHPWVTKDGIDPLLSKEENCPPESMAAPTEEEMNTAITNNMGGLIAVLRAANKFKTLLQHQNPELMESIFHRASRMSQPPLSMTVYQAGSDLKQDLKHFFRAARNKEGNNFAPDQHITSSGIYRDKDVHAEIRHITDHLKHRFVHRQKTVDARMESESAKQMENDLSQIKQEHDKDEIQNRRHSYDDAKGHAHDPLEDQLFLSIGQGPAASSTPDGKEEFVVSESPQPTDAAVYEEAYKEEVEKIHKSGRKSTIFLTRRIDRHLQGSKEADDKGEPVAAGTAAAAAAKVFSPPQESKRARMADLVGKAWQKADDVVQEAREPRDARDTEKG